MKDDLRPAPQLNEEENVCELLAEKWLSKERMDPSVSEQVMRFAIFLDDLMFYEPIETKGKVKDQLITDILKE